MNALRTDTYAGLPLPADDPEAWLRAQVARTRSLVVSFAADRAGEYFTAAGTPILGEVVGDFVGRGKFVRSTFAQLGWLCGGTTSADATPAAASLELLHAFALIQDDVMDESTTRRGRPTVHRQLSDWAESTGRVADPDRFGRSAAILLSDLLLVWAERMLREAPLPAEALQRAWPVFDVLRSELAVGQFGDLLNEDVERATLDDVLEVARRKSGNYTVRRPLELGAALAGCGPLVVQALGRYGTLVGESFQLRDDILGVFGDPAVTGKPVGDDLRQHKATSLTVAARDLASPAQAARLRELSQARTTGGLDEEAWVHEWRHVIESTGAVEWTEKAIAARVDEAAAALHDEPGIPVAARQLLVFLADQCTRRDQ
ncbi:polyprenyl synthetase family protein [Kribbella sp. NPDC020789]